MSTNTEQSRITRIIDAAIARYRALADADDVDGADAALSLARKLASVADAQRDLVMRLDALEAELAERASQMHSVTD